MGPFQHKFANRASKFVENRSTHQQVQMDHRNVTFSVSKTSLTRIFGRYWTYVIGLHMHLFRSLAREIVSRVEQNAGEGPINVDLRVGFTSAKQGP